MAGRNEEKLHRILTFHCARRASSQQHPCALAAPSPLSARPGFVLGIAPTKGQDLALGHVEPPEVCPGPPLQPVQVALEGSGQRQRRERVGQTLEAMPVCSSEHGDTAEQGCLGLGPLVSHQSRNASDCCYDAARELCQ